VRLEYQMRSVPPSTAQSAASTRNRTVRPA
jgi:hypothetical protein